MEKASKKPVVSELIAGAGKRLQPKRIVCDEDRFLGRFEAEVLLAHLLQVDRSWFITHNKQILEPKIRHQFESWVKRREQHEPIAHILGEKEFYKRSFIVNKQVLIPRPETELIIELIIGDKGINPDRSSAPTIWDVGTGSGAIAITLAAEIPSAQILATDVSIRSLEIAKKNAKCHEVNKQITFLKQNLLQPEGYTWLKKNGRTRLGQIQRSGQTPFAPTLIITANLPYLPNSDKQKLEPDVTRFEPSRALFSGDDGLDLIRRFMGQLSRHLPEWNYSDVVLFFEFDPPQTKELKKLAQIHFPKADISIVKDLAAHDRILQIKLNL